MSCSLSLSHFFSTYVPCLLYERKNVFALIILQIHADETKSSLKFASRALRVTNCAQVNEVIVFSYNC